MAFILKNDTLNITEKDIESCNDFETLLNWKYTIDAEIAGISSQIENAKAKAKMEGVYSDNVSMARAKAAKRFQGILSQKIQQRLSQLRKQDTHERNLTHDRAFVLVCKTRLSKELFLEIAEEVNRMIGGNNP